MDKAYGTSPHQFLEFAFCRITHLGQELRSGLQESMIVASGEMPRAPLAIRFVIGGQLVE